MQQSLVSPPSASPLYFQSKTLQWSYLYGNCLRTSILPSVFITHNKSFVVFNRYSSGGMGLKKAAYYGTCMYLYYSSLLLRFVQKAVEQAEAAQKETDGQQEEEQPEEDGTYVWYQLLICMLYLLSIVMCTATLHAWTILYVKYSECCMPCASLWINICAT